VNDRFYDELTQVLDCVYATNCKFVVMGDLNVHVDDVADARTIQLNDIAPLRTLSNWRNIN